VTARTVRTLRPADEPAVRSLQAHLEYADPELVDAALNGPFIGLVAVSEARVVGYAIALPGRETTLSELVVAPDHRRDGHGRELVDAVGAEASGDRLVVTTPANARGARAFYESLGFDLVERLEGFYGDEDEDGDDGGHDEDGDDGGHDDDGDDGGADALRLVRRE
jgi:ribosomal-protein-alanine N-acetyltransferase